MNGSSKPLNRSCCRWAVAWCALRHIEGEDGVALGHALIDMVMSGEVPPWCWPLREIIERLSPRVGMDQPSSEVHGALIWLSGEVHRTLGSS